MRVDVRTYVHIYMYIYIYIYIYGMYMGACIVFMYVCMYLYIYVWKNLANGRFVFSWFCMCVSLCLWIRQNHAQINTYIQVVWISAICDFFVVIHLNVYIHTYIKRTCWCASHASLRRIRNSHSYIHAYTHAYIHACRSRIHILMWLPGFVQLRRNAYSIHACIHGCIHTYTHAHTHADAGVALRVRADSSLCWFLLLLLYRHQGICTHLCSYACIYTKLISCSTILLLPCICMLYACMYAVLISSTTYALSWSCI